MNNRPVGGRGSETSVSPHRHDQSINQSLYIISNFHFRTLALSLRVWKRVMHLLASSCFVSQSCGFKSRPATSYIDTVQVIPQKYFTAASYCTSNHSDIWRYTKYSVEEASLNNTFTKIFDGLYCETKQIRFNVKYAHASPVANTEHERTASFGIGADFTKSHWRPRQSIRRCFLARKPQRSKHKTSGFRCLPQIWFSKYED
jgi:hypothetical protein